jgi:superfamily II DNA or RNA helicase
MPRISANGEEAIHRTLLGRSFIAATVDEAHAFRNPNKMYRAARYLSTRVDGLFIAMTATPIQNRIAVGTIPSVLGILLMHSLLLGLVAHRQSAGIKGVL